MTASSVLFAYLRSGIAGWPPLLQKATIEAAGLMGRIRLAYEDGDGRRLPERDRLLEHDAGGIVVASILVLATSSGNDLIQILKRASDQRLTIQALNEKLTIQPGSDLGAISRVVEAYEKSRKESQTRNGRSKGSKAAMLRWETIRNPSLEIARPLWSMPASEMSTDEIVQRSGLSLATLYRHLGPRYFSRPTSKGKPSREQS